MELSKLLAEKLGLQKLKEEVEKFKAGCSGKVIKRSFTTIHLKTVLLVLGAELALVGPALMYLYEKLENLQIFKDLGVKVFELFSGSVVFVLKVSSISSVKRLWQSYKDGSLKEKLKKSFNEMNELKELSQGKEIDLEVTIDEEEYREVLWNLILLDVKCKSMKNKKSQRRHSVCCERDMRPVVVKGKPMKDARIKCRHSVCCERDFPEGIELKEINRIAARWASFKKEKEIARQCRLLIDGGTRALKDVFDSIHSPSSLHSTLHSTTVHSTLNGLRTEKILSEQQWDRLYPSSPSTPVTSADFDITLLFVLLRNICGLTPPPTGWDKPPVATDLSREADLARVKYYRNELYGHITETAVSDSDFDKYWSEISDALVRLGGPHYKPEIERMKIDTMDPEQEKNFIGALEEWEEMEQTILQKMEEILAKRVKRNSADASQAKEYTEKLKSSIKQQTDFLLSEEEDKKIRTDDIFTSVTIQRGPKHFKEPKEKRFGRRQLDEYQASSTELTNCSEMFLCPENDDQQSTASCTTNPKSILLTGKAGIGKSLLCRKLVRDWSHDRLFEEGQENAKVPDFQFVFLLTFCQLLEEEEKRLDLRDILNRSSLLNDHSVIDEPLLQYIIENPEKLLIVLDGYDEYKHRERITGDLETRYPNDPYDKIPVPALIGKIMKGKMLNGAVVLLSSRPEEAEELKEIVFDVRCDIQRFSSLQVLEYIEKYFNANKSMKNKVLDHIKTNEILLSFGHIPVMCFLMCYCIIWRMTESKTTEKRLPVTRTELYRQVIILFIKKHSSSKYEEMEETKVQELLHKLAELAVNLMMEDKYFFDENDMEKFNLNDEEITNLKASGLIDCCPGVKISPSEKPPLEFAFTDVTIQEFLCAFLFVEKKQIPEKKKTSDVTFMFMAGMFSREKEEKRMEKLIENIKPGNEYDKRNKLLTLSCLYEYKDDGFSTRVMNNLKHIYCRDG